MKKIQLTKEMIKRLENETYYTQEYFIQDCKDYIKAIKEGRMLYLVDTVSNSGMSRTLIIKSCEKNKRTKDFYYRNYTFMFKILGYSLSKDYNIKVSGCGMNMLFATNYNIIHTFKNIGLINSKVCDVLAQKIN